MAGSESGEAKEPKRRIPYWQLLLFVAGLMLVVWLGMLGVAVVIVMWLELLDPGDYHHVVLGVMDVLENNKNQLSVVVCVWAGMNIVHIHSRWWRRKQLVTVMTAVVSLAILVTAVAILVKVA